jgi:hypothetical protein
MIHNTTDEKSRIAETPPVPASTAAGLMSIAQYTEI